LEIFTRRKRLRFNDLCPSTKVRGDITEAGLRSDLVGFKGIVNTNEIDVLLKFLSTPEMRKSENANLIDMKAMTSAMREAHANLRKGGRKPLRKIDGNIAKKDKKEEDGGEYVDHYDPNDDKFTRILKGAVVQTRAKATAAYSNYKFSFDEGSPERVGPLTLSNDFGGEEGLGGEIVGGIEDLSTAAAKSSAWLTSFDKRMQEALGKAG